MLDNPWPFYIVIPWLTVFISCGLGYLYLRFKEGRTTIYGNLTAESEEVFDKKSSDNDLDNKKQIKDEPAKDKKKMKKK